LPGRLAAELKRRFAYAIDPNFQGFIPVFAAASILHPEFCRLLPEGLIKAGKEEIARWINRLSANEVPNPVSIPTSSRFSRLATQRLSIEDPRSAWKRLVDLKYSQLKFSFSYFENYLSLISSPIACDDLYKFWQANRTNFPMLATVAYQILPAPATSSSCERDFSFAGLFTESRKSNISPATLNAKIILAANKTLIKMLDPIEL